MEYYKIKNKYHNDDITMKVLKIDKPVWYGDLIIDGLYIGTSHILSSEVEILYELSEQEWNDLYTIAVDNLNTFLAKISRGN